MTKKTHASSICLAVALTSSSYALPLSLFNANNEYVADVTSGEPSPSFGDFTVGYLSEAQYGDVADAGAFTAFSNSVLPGATPQFTSSFPFPGNANGVEGYRFPNDAVVPAAVVNTNATPTAFGPPLIITPLAPGEMILHPGGITGKAFATPYYSGDLRFTAATAGYYSFSSIFRSIDIGTTVKGVYIDGALYGSASTAPEGVPTAYSGTTFLKAGGTIDFAVGAGSNGIGNDSVGLFASVQAPESFPTLFGGLFLLGLTGFAHFRRVAA